MLKGLIKVLSKTEDLSNFETFMEALPIIGICILGIFDLVDPSFFHLFGYPFIYGLFSTMIKNGEVGELRMFILVAVTLYFERVAMYSHIILPSASPSA